MKANAQLAALLPLLIAGSLQAQALDDKAAAALMTKAACSACHSVDKKGVGPAYKAVALKYKGNAKAADMLAEKVRKGGAGTWGAIPMPPNPKEKVSDPEVKQLIAWILALN